MSKNDVLPPEIKIEAPEDSDSEEPSSASFFDKLRRFSTSSEGGHRTKKTKRMTTSSDTIRPQLLRQVETTNFEINDLEKLVKEKTLDVKKIKANLSYTLSQVNALEKLHQSLIQQLVKENKSDDCVKEEKTFSTIKKRFLMLEDEAEAIIVSSTTTVVIFEKDLIIVEDEQQGLEESMKNVETALKQPDREIVITLANTMMLRWEEYLESFNRCINSLREAGKVQRVRELKDTKINLQLKLMKLERSCGGDNGGNSRDNETADVRTFKYNRKDLPKLTGSVKDWLPFWALFEEIHNDNKLSDVQKLQLLVQSTKEGTEARDVVTSYTMNGKNYLTVYNHMKNLYGRDNVLIKVFVRELLQLAIDKSQGKSMPFRQLVTNITSQIQNLGMLGVKGDKCNQVLYPMIEATLPKNVLTGWQHSPDYSDELEKLMKYLIMEVNHETERNLAHFQFNQTKANEKKPGAGGRGGRPTSKPGETATAASFHNREEDKTCVFCDSKHLPKNCENSSNLNWNQKSEIVKKNGLCFACLEFGHLSTKCPNLNSLKCIKCDKPHCTVMCSVRSNNYNENTKKTMIATDGGQPASQTDEDESENDDEPPTPSGSRSTSTLKNSCSAAEIPLQIIPVILEGNNGKKKIVRALFDTGSQKSYVINSVQDELKFEKIGIENVTHQLFGGGTTRQQQQEIVKIFVMGMNDEFPCTFEVSCVPKITENISQPKSGTWIMEFAKRGVKFPTFDDHSSTIEVLIGNDVAPRLYTGKIEDLGTGPVAMQTKWGWLLGGKLPPPAKAEKEKKTHVTLNLLNFSLADMWNLETIGIQDAAATQSKEELAALTQKHFEKSVERNPDGRYQVALPFLEGSRDLLPTNFAAAHRRLQATTKKLKTDGHFNSYGELFELWKKNGMIEEMPLDPEKGHFLPHRPVIKPSSKTTPIRPVFDASAKPKGRPSLNDSLETGPNYLELIATIVTRFRRDKIGVIADIAKAFQHVSVVESDRKYMQFLWWKDDICKELMMYRHRRVVFGMNCSPFLLVATLRYHLQRAPDTHLETALTLIKSMYVDNLITSVSTMEDAENVQQQSIELLLPAHFDLRGWEFGPCPDGEPISVLGLIWNRQDDTLEIDVSSILKKTEEKITQRVMLSIIHSLFDPLGFLSPFVIVGKLTLRKCYLEKVGWDNPVPTEIEKEFRKWCGQISCLQNLKIPRQVHFHQGTRSLHFFSDASADAYAATGFLRIDDGNSVTVSLIQSNTRVAPKKMVSIPRLELIGCLCICRLARGIMMDLEDGDIQVTYWTDSTTAVAWIQRDGPWGVFVDNRVKEIISLSKKENWRHVPGKLNPADLPSRGCSGQRLVDLQWHKGPEWLSRPPEDWPMTVGAVKEDEVAKERKKIVVSQLTHQKKDVIDDFQRISSYPRILKAVSIWMTVKRNLLGKVRNEPVRVLSPTEKLDEAELLVLKHSQVRLQEYVGRVKFLRPFYDD